MYGRDYEEDGVYLDEDDDQDSEIGKAESFIKIM